MYLSFCIFMPFPEPPMCISILVSFQVQSGGSSVFFSSLRYRRLALYREHFLNLGVGTGAFRQLYKGLVCVYVWTFVSMSKCLYIHLSWIYLYGHLWGHPYISTSASTSLHQQVCQYVHMACIHILLRTHTCMGKYLGIEVVGFLKCVKSVHLSGCLLKNQVMFTYAK